MIMITLDKEILNTKERVPLIYSIKKEIEEDKKEKVSKAMDNFNKSAK